MLSELASSLNHYFLKPSYNKKNLKGKKNTNENNIKNKITQKKEAQKNILIPTYLLGPNFTFKPNELLSPSSPSFNSINNIKKNPRPKSATKLKANIDIKKKFNFDEDEYNLSANMIKFQNLLNIINTDGFQKYQDEINEKKIIIAKLENSISTLKKKISLKKNNTYNKFHKETKNKIKFENMLSIGNRYKNIGKSAQSFKNEINNIRNKISFLNEKTLEMKNIYFMHQNQIDDINNEIKKGNKAISDKQKQIENILAAIQLLKKHIISTKQKIGNIKNIKYNYLNGLNYIENII